MPARWLPNASLFRHAGTKPAAGWAKARRNYRDAANFLALGAETVQFCTAVMKYGLGYVDELHSGLSYLMEERGFGSVKELIGSALPNPITDFGALSQYEARQARVQQHMDAAAHHDAMAGGGAPAAAHHDHGRAEHPHHHPVSTGWRFGAPLPR